MLLRTGKRNDGVKIGFLEYIFSGDALVLDMWRAAATATREFSCVQLLV